MDTNIPNINNTDQSITPSPEQGSEGLKFGPMIGILIIVALLLFGGLYFWGSYLQDSPINSWSAEQATNSDDFNLISDTPTGEEYTMTEEEFNAFIGDDASTTTGAAATTDTALDNALGDMSDLDTLDAEFDNLDLNF